MTNGEVELQYRVETWLNKTGFPLEMRVTRAFEALGSRSSWSSSPDASYSDQATGNVREIDLNVYSTLRPERRPDFVAAVEIIIECKATTPPWVILQRSFSSPTIPIINFTRWAAGTLLKEEEADQLTAFCKELDSHLAATILRFPKPGYSIAEAFKEPGGRDVAYNATRQVVSALQYINSDYFTDEEVSDLGVVWTLPVIITTSPLFEATLSSDSDLIATRPVPFSWVFTADRHSTRRVVVVNEQSLDQFISGIQSLPSEITDFMSNCDWPRLLKNGKWRSI